MSGISPDSGGSSDTTLSDGHAAQAQPKGLTKLACRVPGCTLELRTGFLTRCRCCEFHSRQLSLELNGTLQRFCQQCGFFHPLEDFDDLRRSCRRSLERHRVCRRIRRQRAAEKLAAAAVLQPCSGDKVPRPQVGEEDGLLPTPHLDTEPLPATAASGSKKRRQQAAGGTGRKRAAPAAGSARQPAAASKKQKVQLKAEPLPVVVKVEAAAATTTGNSGITVEQQPPQQRRQPPQQQQSLQRRQPLGSGPCQQQQQHSSESQVLLHTSVRLTPARLPAQTSFVTTLAQPPQLPASAMPAPPSAQPVGSPSQASVEGPRPMQPGSARAVIAATQQLMAAPPSASLAAAVPPSEWGGYLESIQPFVQHQLAVPPPPVLVEEALRILRAPTPSFMDIPSVSEMLDITADLGMLEELMQQHGPRHALDLKSSSTTDSITPFTPAWPYLHLAPHVDLTAAARMH